MGFESLYIGATGLKTHGERMSVIGNNLANVNTIGFKGAEVHFQNLFSDTIAGGDGTTQGLNQIGQGSSVAAILGDFRQGGIDPGNVVTDLAIGGKGYFRVVKDGEIEYTRAGNFRFDNQGYLVGPTGFRLQGQNIVDGVNQATGDIQLDLDENYDVTVPPQATTQATLGLNLGSQMDHTSSANHPFFSLLENWEGTSDPPLGENAYDYVNTMKIYDDQGQDHVLSVYFDGAGTASGANGYSYIEFVAGIDPAEDGRAGFAGTSAAGLLMSGVLTFNNAGQLVGMAAYTPGTVSAAGSVKSLSSWVPAELNADGTPVIDAQFAAASGATAGAVTMGLGMGLESTTASWSSTGASNASAVGASASNLAVMGDADRAALATTAYQGTTSTLYQTQDGYAEGSLMSMTVTRDGTFEGTFSNGVVEGLFQVTLYTFTSDYGLHREGSNHFSETLASGTAVEGLPDQAQYGYITGTSLETSNVDVAKQFADMIVTERGFQANSKIISTTDTILQTLIQLKR